VLRHIRTIRKAPLCLAAAPVRRGEARREWPARRVRMLQCIWTALFCAPPAPASSAEPKGNAFAREAPPCARSQRPIVSLPRAPWLHPKRKCIRVKLPLACTVATTHRHPTPRRLLWLHASPPVVASESWRLVGAAEGLSLSGHVSSRRPLSFRPR